MAKQAAVDPEFENALLEDISSFYDDPLGYVKYAFPWGEKGTTLEDFDGPDEWQAQQLTEVGEAIKADPSEFVIRECIASGHGIGKLLFYKEKVPTPTGTRRWGDLVPGDLVFGADGKPTRITQTHHYRQLDRYRVTFDDGSHCDVSSGHLWNVRGRQERRKKLDTWRTLETIEILRLGVKRANGKAQARQWEIPIQGAAEFEEREIDVHPYVLGVWIGDGSKGTPQITKPYPEVPEKIRQCGYRVSDYHADGKAFTVHGLDTSDPVFSCGSHERYLPEDYLHNTVENRMALLEGLCDSDGEVHKSGSIGYATTSRQLAEDVIWLARSLGCKAMMQSTVKKGWYPGEDGERVECRGCYRVTINAPFNPFSIPHKRNAYKPSEERYLKRWIESIEVVGRDDGMCISVEAEDGLYLANDFIVTHNSAETAWIILWAMSTRPHLAGVVTANTRNQLTTKTWRELAVWWKRAINAHWFEWTATKFYHVEHEQTWAVNAIPNTERNSEAFAGLHGEHVLIIYDEACHDDQTDVLTSEGWRRFAELDGTELLATMHPETGIVGYEQPTALTRSPYKGPMHLVDRRGASFCVTPNHRMLHKSYAPRRPDRRSDWKLTPIAEMSEGGTHFIPKTLGTRGYTPTETFCIPEHVSARKTYPARTVEMREWLRFLGWYFSEGNVTRTPSGAPSSVTLSQAPSSPHRGEVERAAQWLADTAGKKVTVTVSQVIVHDAQTAAFLSQFGKNALEKRLPGFLRGLAEEEIRLFLEAFIAGDGYWRGSNAVLYTSSPKMADDLHEICLLAGGSATLTTRKASGEIDFGTHVAFSGNDGYVVYWNPEGDASITLGGGRGLGEVVDYDGVVYCATVDSGLLFTRRNGRCMWSGNSAIPDVIWEVSEGAMTTPRAMWFAFGNPTRNTGRFHSCFHEDRHRWNQRKIDSRTCRMTNKKELQEWVDTYGEDSDFVRVRIRGEFPRAGSMQFIPSNDVDIAMMREYPEEAYILQPIILAADVARFGDDKSVIALRQGRKLIQLFKYRELNTMEFAREIAAKIREYQPVVSFVDEVGVGAGVVDRLRQLGYEIVGVNAGSKADDYETYYNKRAEMWGRMREWIRMGGQLPKDDMDLRTSLIGVEYGFTDASTGEKLRLESKKDMKKRGLDSPDEGDALAYTFAEITAPTAESNSFEPDDAFEPEY